MTNIQGQFILVYKTAISPYFLSCLVGNCFSSRLTHLLPSPVTAIPQVTLLSKGTVNWYFDKRLRRTALVVFEKIFSSPTLLGTMQRKARAIERTVKREISVPPSSLFTRRKVNQAGAEKLRRLFRHYQAYSEVVDAPGFLFQVFLTTWFRRRIFSRVASTTLKKEEIFQTLLSSHKLTNYERFLVAISHSLGNPRGYVRIARDYQWLIHDYLGEIIDAAYVARKAQEFLGDRTILDLHIRMAHQRCAKIAETLRQLPSPVRKDAEKLLPILFDYSETKKEIVNQANIFLRRIIEYRFPRYTFSQIKHLCALSPEEMLSVLQGARIPADLRNRNNLYGYLTLDWNVRQAPKKYLKLLQRFSDSVRLRGTPASPGRARGRVNVILNISHIFKFRPGDILVAPFTNVNYLPIMAKAKAIITETGGLTSHAAVVSRELQLPCIVKVANATSILQDGDTVDIDAQRGTIEKI